MMRWDGTSWDGLGLGLGLDEMRYDARGWELG